MVFDASLACAEQLDAADTLARYRAEFAIPTDADGNETIYLVGNSLGAMPHRARNYVTTEMERWGSLGVEGHFTGELAWEPYHELLTEPLARIVGARPEEVVAMNSLTVNLHLLMVSFYRPEGTRRKILIEEHAFPSDHFAVESQIRFHGGDPAKCLVTVGPRQGAATIDPDDLFNAIAECGDELALVMLPGVQYYTGQVLPMAGIVAAGHAVGAKVGFDLAHAVGNVPLDLHNWGADFAAWCTYKYLNSGPGGVGGAFVHERHLRTPDLPKFLGWWGTRKDTRFQMETVYEPIPTVESWQLSNAPILSMAALRGSLELIDEAGGITVLRHKSERQIRYLDYLLNEELDTKILNLTPTELADRGAQFALSITMPGVDGRAVYEALETAGVRCDWRYPNVIRVAPVPLYNTFVDIHRFVAILKDLLP
ncbi:MAG: kynureninase [Acidimicrobiales bacterium]|nr:kynureninase [Acidimicrobiales bacterium]